MLKFPKSMCYVCVESIWQIKYNKFSFESVHLITFFSCCKPQKRCHGIWGHIAHLKFRIQCLLMYCTLSRYLFLLFGVACMRRLTHRDQFSYCLSVLSHFDVGLLNQVTRVLLGALLWICYYIFTTCMNFVLLNMQGDFYVTICYSFIYKEHVHSFIHLFFTNYNLYIRCILDFMTAKLEHDIFL